MKKNQKIITVVVILVVLGGVSVGLALWLSSRQPAPRPETENTTGLSVTDQPAEKKAVAAEKQANTGDVAGGTKTLDEAIKSTEDPHEKFVYYSRKATLLFNDGQHEPALAAAKQAYELEKGSAAAAFTAQVAEAKGDRAQAVEYYKKAVADINKADPMADEDERYYKMQITRLEGTNG